MAREHRHVCASHVNEILISQSHLGVKCLESVASGQCIVHTLTRNADISAELLVTKSFAPPSCRTIKRRVEARVSRKRSSTMSSPSSFKNGVMTVIEPTATAATRLRASAVDNSDA